MNKLYNTQKNLARDLAKFFQKTTIITKPQLKIIPYIILGMIEAESVVTNDIVKKLKGNFSLVNPFSTVRRWRLAPITPTHFQFFILSLP